MSHRVARSSNTPSGSYCKIGMLHVERPDLALPSTNDIRTYTLVLRQGHPPCTYSHACRHAHTPNDLWTCIDARTSRARPGPESPGRAIKEASPSQVASHYSPLVRCIWESVWGHPSLANKWGNRVSKGEADGRRGALLTPAHPHTHTLTRTPPGYRLQPPFHLCLCDLPNDVFIYSSAARKHTRLHRAACHTITNGGIREAFITLI